MIGFTNKELIELIRDLSNNFTDIISKKELSTHGNIGKFTNGIGNRWCRKIFNYTVIYSKGDQIMKLYSTNPDDTLPDFELVNNFVQNYNENNDNKFRKIIGIYINSFNTVSINRPIKQSILRKIRRNSCVNCNSNVDIICDHKNDLYNDERVLKTKTQVLDDFQPLCNHCNLLKRNNAQRELNENRITSCKTLNQFRFIDYDIPWEKYVFDVNDINCKKESYWYDPIEFNRKINIYNKIKLLILPYI